MALVRKKWTLQHFNNNSLTGKSWTSVISNLGTASNCMINASLIVRMIMLLMIMLLMIMLLMIMLLMIMLLMIMLLMIMLLMIMLLMIMLLMIKLSTPRIRYSSSDTITTSNQKETS